MTGSTPFSPRVIPGIRLKQLLVFRPINTYLYDSGASTSAHTTVLLIDHWGRLVTTAASAQLSCDPSRTCKFTAGECLLDQIRRGAVWHTIERAGHNLANGGDGLYSVLIGTSSIRAYMRGAIVSQFNPPTERECTQCEELIDEHAAYSSIFPKRQQRTDRVHPYPDGWYRFPLGTLQSQVETIYELLKTPPSSQRSARRQVP